MTPYNPGQYVPGITVLNLVPASLGLLVPPGVLASQYQQVLNGTIRNAALWPTVSYKSYFGQFYDTVYVVDTLRLWTECPQCQYGVANTVARRGRSRNSSSKATTSLSVTAWPTTRAQPGRRRSCRARWRRR